MVSNQSPLGACLVRSLVGRLVPGTLLIRSGIGMTCLLVTTLDVFVRPCVLSRAMNVLVTINTIILSIIKNDPFVAAMYIPYDYLTLVSPDVSKMKNLVVGFGKRGPKKNSKAKERQLELLSIMKDYCEEEGACRR